MADILKCLGYACNKVGVIEARSKQAARKLVWRPLFFLGGLPALLALFVRVRVKESEVWQKSKQESWSGIGRAFTGQHKLFLYLVLLMTGMNLSSHGTQDM